nr:hypothetical protein [Tanacetum cinerariifolium]
MLGVQLLRQRCPVAQAVFHEVIRVGYVAKNSECAPVFAVAVAGQ